MRSRAALAALLLGWLCQPATASESLFQVDAGTHFSLPIRPENKYWASLITYDQDKVTLSSVVVVAISRPDGQALSLSDMHAELVDSANQKFIAIKPQNESALQVVGDYRLVVQLQGMKDGKPVSQLVTLTFNRPELSLEVDHPAGKSVTLYRNFPWSDASGAVPYVFEISKPGERGLVFLSTRPVERAKETGAVVGDSIAWLEPEILHVHTGIPSKANVVFSTLKEAGDFATTVRIASESMSKPIVVPLAIHIKDKWFFPCLAILLGVAGGAWVSSATTTRRAILKARYDISELRLRVQLIGPAIMGPQRGATYQLINSQLDDVEREIDMGEQPAVDVAKIAAALSSLESDLSALQVKVANQLNDLLQQMQDEKTDLSALAPSIGVNLAPIEVRARAAAAMNAAGKIEYAEGEATLCGKLLGAETRNAQTAVVTDLTQRIQANAAAAADPLITQRLSALNLAIGSQYALFQTALLALKQALPAGTLPSSKPSKTAAPSGSPFTIQVDSSKTPQTGDIIELRVDCGTATTIPDTVVWNFNNGRIATISQSLLTTQSYQSAGKYQISVQLYSSRDPNFHETAVLRLDVTPGSGLQAILRAARAIKANEWSVRVLALILAVLTGVLALYCDKPFGTFVDYATAILWGFGVEKTVRGFGGVASALGIKPR